MSRKITISGFFSAFLLSVSSSSNAGIIVPELLNQISTNRSSEKVDVIIEFTNRNNLFNRSSNSRKDIITILKTQNINSLKNVKSLLDVNQIQFKDLWIKNAIAVSVPANLLPLIASQKDVSLIRLDKKIILNTSIQGNEPININWNIAAIGADALWNTGVTGEGVVIGSMDSGVDINHPDLSESWRGGTNSWFDPYGIHSAPYDSNGHGTQTTSIIVGGNASGYNIGVAPGSKWIAAKIFDDTNMASISAIHLAFQWMIDPDNDPETDDGANIINNSWNFETVTDECNLEFQDDITILRSADIAVVFSAGNSGPNSDTSHSPANNTGTISIGATDEIHNVAFFSSRGPSACDQSDVYPKLVAPGVNILSADLTFGGVVPDSYTYTSGTSFSTPHVSGALALLQSKFPSSTLSDRETALYNTAVFTEPANDFGFGLIDIISAFDYMSPVANLLSPSGNIDTNPSTLFSWNSVVSADQYKILLIAKGSNDRIIDEVYTAEELGCLTESTCTLATSSTLEDGIYRWRVRTKNSLGWGPWSNKLLFTIGNGETPAATDLVSPNEDIFVYTPSFTWSAVSNSTQYKLLVIGSSSLVPIIDQVYSFNETGCATGTICTFTPSIQLPSDKYRWRIRTKNQFGWGTWSSLMRFSIE